LPTICSAHDGTRNYRVISSCIDVSCMRLRLLSSRKKKNTS
jgi:hypothetical protein